MSQFFRAGVGAVIINHKNQVLALERSDTPGAWQFPQGGLDDQEEPLAAALREVQEETGIEPAALGLIRQHPRLLSYELPPAWRSAKVGRGQTQHWFLFRLLAGDDAIDLPMPGEFRAWQWLAFSELLPLVADFRRGLYQDLGLEFAELGLRPPA